MPPLLLAMKARIASKGEVEVSLRGQSMHPLLLDGDKALVLKASEFDVGRVYLFVLDEKMYAHRLICLEEGYLVFRGDHSIDFDIVSRNAVVGEVVGVMNSNGQKLLLSREGKWARKLKTSLSRRIGEMFSSSRPGKLGILRRRALCKSLDAINRVERNSFLPLKSRKLIR